MKKNVTFRLNAQTDKELSEASERLRITRTAIVELAIADFLKRNQKRELAHPHSAEQNEGKS